MSEDMLTDKQERFCKEYLIDLNATQAAIRAGYSPHRAHVTGSTLLANRKVSERLKDLMAKKDAALIATADEVLQRLTAILRGQVGNHRVVKTRDTDEDGNSVIADRIIELPPDACDISRAAELLGKRYGLYTEKVEATVDLSGEAMAEIDRIMAEDKEHIP